MVRAGAAHLLGLCQKASIICLSYSRSIHEAQSFAWSDERPAWRAGSQFGACERLDRRGGPARRAAGAAAGRVAGAARLSLANAAAGARDRKSDVPGRLQPGGRIEG